MVLAEVLCNNEVLSALWMSWAILYSCLIFSLTIICSHTNDWYVSILYLIAAIFIGRVAYYWRYGEAHWWVGSKPLGGNWPNSGLVISSGFIHLMIVILRPNSRSYFRAGVSLNIHSFIHSTVIAYFNIHVALFFTLMEGNVFFNDALNTFYLLLYGFGHIV